MHVHALTCFLTGLLLIGMPARAQTAVTAFVNVAVVPMDRDTVMAHHTIVVQHGRIIALGPVGQVQVPTGAVRIDGRGRYVMPGLADMHFHLALGGATHVERSLFLLLANGVTTVRNIDYLPASHPWQRLEPSAPLSWRERAAAGTILSPRIYTSGVWRTDTGSSIEANLRAYKAAGYDFLKIHDEKVPTIDSLAPIARRLEIPIVGHVRGDLTHAMSAGYASIEHLTGYGLRNLEALSDSVIASMARATRDAGVWNCPTMFLAEGSRGAGRFTTGQRYLPADWNPVAAGGASRRRVDQGARELAARRHIVQVLQQAGAGLLLGTDVPAVPGAPGFTVHLELEALVLAGLTPYQALATGTRNVAEFFGTLAESGTIAVGKRADLVMLYGNPLRNVRHTARPAGVMIGGRWLSRTRLDELLADYVVDSD